MAKIGWKVPYVTSSNSSMSNYIDNAGANGEGVRTPAAAFIFLEDAPFHQVVDVAQRCVGRGLFNQYYFEEVSLPSNQAIEDIALENEKEWKRMKIAS